MAAISGRPDGRLANYIYDGGLNGVIDWRLPAVANDSPEEAAKVEAKVENGTYRGLEKLVWTHIEPQQTTQTITTAGVFVGYHNGFRLPIAGSGFTLVTLPVWKHIQVVGDNGADVVISRDPGLGNTFGEGKGFWPHSNNNCYMVNVVDAEDAIDRLNAAFPVGTTLTLNVIVEEETNLSVSGEFNHTDVIGDPANILQTDALKNGWLGTWCPAIPNLVGQEYSLTRKAIDKSALILYIPDYVTGAWETRPATVWRWDSVKNSHTVGLANPGIAVIPYKAFAKQTKPSTNKPVYNAKAGLMDVFATESYQEIGGVLLGESLLGKVCKHIGNNPPYEMLSVLKPNIAPTDGTFKSWMDFTHTPISLAAPNNNSQAVKVLPYQISNNGQGSIGYQANELAWGTPTFTDALETKPSYAADVLYRITDGPWRGFYRCVRTTTAAGGIADVGFSRLGDGNIVWTSTGNTHFIFLGVVSGSWGDDSTMKITADGSDTFVDLNGNTNLSVVHELAIPYTWTSNHARAGEQVEGVDL